MLGGITVAINTGDSQKNPDATRMVLVCLVRESNCESNGSEDPGNIAAMVTTKGVKLSRWRITKLIKELNLIILSINIISHLRNI